MSDKASKAHFWALLRRGRSSIQLDGVSLPETGFFPLFRGIVRTDRDAAFQGIYRFGQAFPFQLQRIFVFFEVLVNGCGGLFS
jgi:hypothetical protein